MKNLIIHPEDKSTTFLKPIYQYADNQMVIEKDSCPEQIVEMIERSDRVMMMGHGCPWGLFSIKMFPKHYGMAINRNHKDLLKDKTENIYIWCNADKYVEYHDLKGFYSGMFISEVGEAKFCGLKGVTQEMVDESNNAFARITGQYINTLPVKHLHELVTNEYAYLALRNPVARYNLERLYVR